MSNDSLFTQRKSILIILTDRNDESTKNLLELQKILPMIF